MGRKIEINNVSAGLAHSEPGRRRSRCVKLGGADGGVEERTESLKLEVAFIMQVRVHIVQIKKFLLRSI